MPVGPKARALSWVEAHHLQDVVAHEVGRAMYHRVLDDLPIGRP
tara:strand:+ start:1875 stop:2006 length:132 start_codon:yes stop_codon:yes gene_type:complete